MSAEILGTADDEAQVVYYESCAYFELILLECKRIKVNIIVDPHIDEVLISDYVASEFGIILLDLRKGLWKLKDDLLDKVRESER